MQPEHIGASTNVGQGGFLLGALQTKTILASGTYAIPAGMWIVIPDSNGKIQFNRATQSAPTWTDYCPAGAGSTIVTDGGVTFQVLNTSGGSSSTCYLSQVL